MSTKSTSTPTPTSKIKRNRVGSTMSRRFHKLVPSKSVALIFAVVAVAVLNFTFTYHDIHRSDRRDIANDTSFHTPPRTAGSQLSSTTGRSTISESSPIRQKRKYVPDDDDLLLSVPFYVYPELLDIVDHATYGKNNRSISVHETIANGFAFDGGSHKHDDDYHFIQSARYHPMRTLDADEAKLFVVPVLFNLATLAYHYSKERSDNHGLCYDVPMTAASAAGATTTAAATTITPTTSGSQQQQKWRYCNDQLVDYVDQFLARSPYFQKHNGTDHMVTLPFFHWDAYTQDLSALRNCNAITFGDMPIPLKSGRLSLPKLYVGNSCNNDNGENNDNKKLYDFALIATLRSGPKYRFRRRICEWLSPNNDKDREETNNIYQNQILSKSEKATIQHRNVTMEFCGAGPQCPALAQAKYGFHVRGDSHSSNRLFDILLSGTVPIFTTAKQYWGVPDFIDWDKLSYFVDMLSIETDEVLFRNNISSIVNDVDGYIQKHNAVRQNRDLFDWTSGSPFDMYMYRLQVYLWPELALKSSRFSALKLT